MLTAMAWLTWRRWRRSCRPSTTCWGPGQWSPPTQPRRGRKTSLPGEWVEPALHWWPGHLFRQIIIMIRCWQLNLQPSLKILSWISVGWMSRSWDHLFIFLISIWQSKQKFEIFCENTPVFNVSSRNTWIPDPTFIFLRSSQLHHNTMKSLPLNQV